MTNIRPWLVAGLALAAFPAVTATAQTGLRARANCDGRTVALSGVPRTHTQPPYPPISQRLGEQGASVLQIAIDRGGAVEETAVMTSSGSNRLDTAAQDWVRRQWRWQPSSTSCRALTTIVTIRWRLVDTTSLPR